MKKHHIIAAVITLAPGMGAFGQDTAAPSLSKLEALAQQATPPAPLLWIHAPRPAKSSTAFGSILPFPIGPQFSR